MLAAKMMPISPIPSAAKYRPTWAEIDLAALVHNYRRIKSSLPDRAQVMAMVKADAYGHGAVEISRALEGCGVRALGVATVEEAIELRRADIGSQIIVMGGLMGVGSPASKAMIDEGLTPVIHSADVLDSIESEAARAGRVVNVHLKIDTGMSRLGVRVETISSMLAKLEICKHVRLEGAMTHLAEADDDARSSEQLEKFIACKRAIEGSVGRVKIWHIANSTAVIKGSPVEIPDSEELWVRPGLALYGSQGGIDERDSGLKAVMRLVSRAVLLKNVPAGSRVSYGGTYVTSRPSRLAVVPIGYADGYPWKLSGRSSVLIRGVRAPIAGRVSMDMIVVDVTDVKDVSLNDEVILMGRQGDSEISVDELAGYVETIPYEILCGISKRMPRVFTQPDTL